MKLSHIFPAVVLLGCLSFSSNTFAVIDNNAPVVQLQTSCTTGGVALNNCFTSMASVVNWITTVRTPKPSAAAPLTVQIGPGTFDPLTLTCNAASGFTGYIHFAGAGRAQSTIKGSGPLVTVPMVIRNCTALSFADLGVVSPGYGYIDWGGGGTSVWENMDVIGQSRAWVETCGSSPGLHYWFNSRLSSSGFGINVPYQATCDVSWFYGSDISTNALGPVVQASASAQLHIYGSNLRADDSVGGGLMGAVIVAQATNNGMIHIHGTGMDATGGTGRTVHALEASSGGMIHANGVGYFLGTGAGGTVARIANNGGMVMAPYVWEEGTAPQNITSDNGADMQVVTNNTDGQPHLVIYSTACSSRWFDTVTHACH